MGEGAAALILRAIQGEIGAAHQHFDRPSITWADGCTDAGTDIQGVLVDFIWPGQGLDDLLGEHFHIVRVGCILHHDRKFVATQSAAQFIVGHDRSQTVGYACQQPVAHRMAERVVDRLETVEVDHHQAATTVPLVRRLHGLSRRVGQLQPVGQTGKRIEPGQMGDFVGRFALFGNIRTNTAETVKSTVIVELWRSGQFPPAVFTIDLDRYQHVAETVATFQFVCQFVQCGGEVSALP